MCCVRWASVAVSHTTRIIASRVITNSVTIHSLGENTIMVVVEMRIIGALCRHFIAKTDIPRRMVRGAKLRIFFTWLRG